MLKHTPLWAAHQRLAARLVPFGGWDMPVQYTSIVDEHLAVRSAAGLFDISHMGEIVVQGAAALEFLNATLTNDLRNCPVGRGQYTLMCNETGGVVDDLYAYHTQPEEFLLVVNASRIDDDFAWLQGRWALFANSSGVQVTNRSDAYGAIAVQGPKVADFIDQVVEGELDGGTAVHRPTSLEKNEIGAFAFAHERIWLARTGYTGEDGFELLAPAALTESLWEKLLETGQASGVKPCGLGARDTLRTEMCYPLYGHELDAHTTPLEAGLGFFVALDKGAFVGRDALLAQKAQGVTKRCIAFIMSSKSAPPRPGYPLWDAGAEKRIGAVVSGTQSPSLGIGIGLGYVAPDLAAPGTRLQVEIRGKMAGAEIVRKPIYRKPH